MGTDLKANPTVETWGVHARGGAPASLARSTKRKASGKESWAASGSRTPRPRATRCKKTKDDDETTANGAAAEPGGVNKPQKRRLPAKDVRCILSQKPRAPPETYEALKRGNPALVLRPEEEDDEDLVTLYLVARAWYDLQEKMPKVQDRMRGELEEKGYVEVDEDWFRRRDEGQAVIDREWPSIRAMKDELCIEGGGGGGDDESESDESDEEEGEDE